MMSDGQQFQEKLQAQLDEWGIDLAQLRAKAAQTSEAARLAMDIQLVTLEAKLQAGQERLAELADTSEDAWASMQGGLESAWSSLTVAFSEAAEKLSNPSLAAPEPSHLWPLRREQRHIMWA